MGLWYNRAWNTSPGFTDTHGRTALARAEALERGDGIRLFFKIAVARFETATARPILTKGCSRLFKKTFLTMIAALILLTSASMAALANPYTLGAENGKLLPPAGLGLDVNTDINRPDQSDLAVNAEVGYGISSKITIAGAVRDLNHSDRQSLVKAYYSPARRGLGYTVYLGYDLDARNIPMYGLSLWTNLHFLYGYLNLEKENTTLDDSIMVTPGVSLALGPKLRVGGELTMNTDDWSGDNLRIGASYALTRKVYAKAMVDHSFGHGSSNLVSAGLAMQF